MWGMTAVKKGTAMKDKKKRAGGGGSPPPPSFVFRIAPHSTIGSATGQSGWSHSGFDFFINDDSVVPPVIANDMATNIALGGGPPGGPFTKIPMDDAAATTLASSPATLIHSTTAQTAAIELQAFNDYTLEYDVSISPGANHGTVNRVFYTTDAVHDPNSLKGGAVRLGAGSMPYTSAVTNSQSPTFRDTQGIRISGGGAQINPGDEIIIEITATVVYNNKAITPHSMTTETVSNLTGGTASATESMYIRLRFV
tara:strand:- start:2 stop:763 length:762 start_codon:yes stop_codon:yes gene_type:complete